MERQFANRREYKKNIQFNYRGGNERRETLVLYMCTQFKVNGTLLLSLADIAIVCLHLGGGNERGVCSLRRGQRAVPMENNVISLTYFYENLFAGQT